MSNVWREPHRRSLWLWPDYDPGYSHCRGLSESIVNRLEDIVPSRGELFRPTH